MKKNPHLGLFDELDDCAPMSIAHCEKVGLAQEEFERLVRLMGRKPNKVELGIVGALWSEHCSYKSTKAHLSKLPTTGKHVLVGPGENAGAILVDEDSNLAVVFKVESHNHPSFIEPFQGAATGVGGILRDIFTMGARPFACLNLLRFGEKTNAKVPHLLDGVVRGIASYGNCFGVPTVLSNVDFHDSYNGNNLVNAFAIGVVKKDAIFLGSAAGPKNRVLYVGAKTGRDGIQGAIMASDVFGHDSDDKRPTVQVGDPFKEKLLQDACLMCFAERLVIGIQDMGAAGMTSSSFEMANRASTGLLINLDLVPLRDLSMNAYEIMLSESQERMLMVVEPKNVTRIAQIFARFELDCCDIGEVSSDGAVKIMHKNREVVNLNATLVIENAPRYRRSYLSTIAQKTAGSLVNQVQDQLSLPSVMEKFHQDLGQKDLSFITEQFDHHIGLNTLVGPNESDAVLLRVPGSSKAVAITLLAKEKLVAMDPFEGARRTVFLALLHISAQGARPAGISNCLNFGSPKNEGVMTHLKHAIDGLAQGALSIATPIISGNVSLYNETLGQPILPTLALALVGLSHQPKISTAFARAARGDILVVLGDPPRDYAGSEAIFATIPPGNRLNPWDENYIKMLSTIVLEAVMKEITPCVGVIERGGLMLCVQKIMAKSKQGILLEFGPEWLSHEVFLALLSEDAPRVLMSVSEKNVERLHKLCAQKIPIQSVGTVGGDEFSIVHQGETLYRGVKDSMNAIYHNSLGEFLGAG